MLKNILKITGIQELNKKNQASIIGGHHSPGNPCDSYNGPNTYGYPGSPSCADYFALPQEYSFCVRVNYECFDL